MALYNQGPVVQSPIKLFLDWWKILIVVYLPLKEDFEQDEGLRKRNLLFKTMLGHNFVANPPLAVNK